MLRKHIAIIVFISSICILIWAARLEAIEQDPFVSMLDIREEKKATSAKIDLSGAVLKGIIWNKNRAVAIINDEPVVCGEEWRGLKIERIEQDKVILGDGEKSYSLYVQKDDLAPKKNLTGNERPISGQEQEAQNNNENNYGPPGMPGTQEFRHRPDMPYQRE
jgi:hypothetical protein